MDPEARPGGALTARPPPLATQTCPRTAAGAPTAAMVLRDDALPTKPDLAGDWPAEPGA